jgi:hypothetical protein
MADFEKSLELVYQVEYSCKPDKALHQVSGENFITYKGINRKANPNFKGWAIIDKILKDCGSLSKASICCNDHDELETLTKDFYKINYWNPNKLDDVLDQHIADEIFTTGVLTHPKTAAKFAQRVIGVNDDGVIGPASLKALNSYSSKLFDKEYDDEEIKHYMNLIKNNPKFKIYEKGWKNRAVAI